MIFVMKYWRLFCHLCLVNELAVEQVNRQKDGVPSITIKKKTHGFLPLFVSQFFLLLATLGVGAVLFVLPEKQLKEIQDVSFSFKLHDSLHCT